MKKIILAITVLLITGATTVAQTSTPTAVSYRILVNTVPSGFNYPLIGLVNNVHGNHSSLQIGFINSNTGNFEGFQAGFINSVGGDFKGGQTGFINSVEGNFLGVEWGFVNSVKGNLHGIQGGFINSINYDLTGVQTGFINSTSEVEGVQVGFINSAGSLNGVQVGFINSVDYVERGLPIGMLSVVKYGGYKAIELSRSSISPVNISFKTGIRHFYTYPVLAYNEELESNKFLLGYGLGSIIDFKRWFINPEYEGLHQVSADFNHYTTLRFNIGYSLNRRLEILAGPSLIWQVKIDAADLPQDFSRWNRSMLSVIEITGGYGVAIRYKF